MIIALTNLFGPPGGIPAFNRLLCHAAWEWTRARALPLQVLAMMDAVGGAVDPQVLPAAAGVSYAAFGGGRARFAAAVARGHLRWPAPRLCLGHVNLAPLGLSFAAARPLGLARGFGVVAHGTEVWTPLPRLRREALRRARAVACVSDDTARKVAGVQGVAAARALRVINALDPWRFPLPLAVGEGEVGAGQGDGLVRLLSVTRLSPEEPKGVDLVIRALPRLPPAVVYTVVGDGEARPALQALAVELGVASRVRFLGRVSDEARAVALAACDVFALPSAGEGFGIVYLEAMAYRKPCLAARVGGAPEVVVDGQTGLVVDPTVDGVAAGLGVLCADAALRRAQGAAGWARLYSAFTYPRFREAAWGFFDRL